MSVPAEAMVDGAPTPSSDTSTDEGAEIVSDDSDLGNDFQEMDDGYSKDFETSDLPEKEEVAEVEEAPETEEEVESEVDEGEAEETSIESQPEAQTTEQLLAQLAATQAELLELRKLSLEGQETEDAQTEATDKVSDESFKAAREQARTSLQQKYALSAEDADKMITEPEAILPRMAADIHMEVTSSVVQAIRSALPGWIEHSQKEALREKEAHGELFTTFPALKDHAAAVDPVLASYKALNPDATPEEVIAKGGAMAMMALGLKLAPVVASGKTVAKPRATPHRPAAGAGRAGKPTRKDSDNEFSNMAEEDVID